MLKKLMKTLILIYLGKPLSQILSDEWKTKGGLNENNHHYQITQSSLRKGSVCICQVNFS